MRGTTRFDLFPRVSFWWSSLLKCFSNILGASPFKHLKTSIAHRLFRTWLMDGRLILPLWPLMIFVARFWSFSSLDLCESEIPMLMLLQYRNKGRIIILYMVSAVVGLIFMRTLASNLILEDTFLYIFSNWLNRFRFLSSCIPRYSYLSDSTIFWLFILISISSAFANFWWLPKSTNSVLDFLRFTTILFSTKKSLRYLRSSFSFSATSLLFLSDVNITLSSA